MSASDAVQNPPVQTEADDNDPAANFSSYFTIHNLLPVALIYKEHGAHKSKWVSQPPQTIKSNFTTSELRIKDDFGTSGSSGWVTYTAKVGDDGLAKTIRIDIACPVTGHNSAKITSTTPADFYLSVSPFSTSGHPLKVAFTVEAAPVQ